MSLKWSYFPGLKEVKMGPVTSGVFVPVSACLRAASGARVRSILAVSYGPPPRGGPCSPLAHAARIFQGPWSSCEGLHPVPRKGVQIWASVSGGRGGTVGVSRLPVGPEEPGGKGDALGVAEGPPQHPVPPTKQGSVECGPK